MLPERDTQRCAGESSVASGESIYECVAVARAC